jgi:hypothetical protein
MRVWIRSISRTWFHWTRGHHQAGLAGPGRAARAVQVGLVVLGRIEVDDHVDHVDVEAPGGHVGGHQGGQLALGEVLQGPLPVGLAEVAVDGVGLDALLPELLDQPVGAPLGAHEDQGLLLSSGRWRRTP